MLANMRTPTGMATPIPILLEVGSPEEVAEGLALGPEFGVGDSVIEEDFAVGSECTDLVPVELFAVAGLTAALESLVVVAELIKKLEGVVVVNALGVPIGLAMTVPPANSMKTEVGLIDGKFVVITVAEGTLEGSSVPHVSQLSEPGLVTLH